MYDTYFLLQHNVRPTLELLRNAGVKVSVAVLLLHLKTLLKESFVAPEMNYPSIYDTFTGGRKG